MDYTKYCALTYDGKLIDELIPGYETINVDGRGLKAPKLSTINIDGRDGDYVESQKLEPRDIKVFFTIRTLNNKERLDTMDWLDFYLSKKRDVIFSFGDQEGYWVGRYSDATDINYDYFIGQGYFILHCQNPYRHMPLLTYTGNSVTVTSELYKKLVIEEITGTVSSTTEIRIRNSRTGQVISLKNLTGTGSFLLNKQTITINGQNVVNKLDPSVSTWKEFNIESGDELQIIGLTNPTVKIRRYL